MKPADDSTLKLEWAALLGVNALVASTSTTAGVATSGTYCPDLDGTDFEGETTGGILTSAYGVYYSNSSISDGLATITCGTTIVGLELPIGGQFLMSSADGMVFNDDVTIGTSSSSLVTVTIAGA